MEKLLELFYRYKYQIILGLGLVLIVAGIGVVLYINDKEVVPEEKLEEVSILETKVEEPIVKTDKIKINIKGAVANQGVYELDSNSRVIDAIDVSGGLLNSADTSILNLSKKLKDEDVIIVYTNEEVRKIKEGNVVIQYIEKECNCPDVSNGACIDPDSLISDNVNKDDNSTKEETNTNSSLKISINTATLDELQTLTGIGKSKAEAIIEYRTTNGLFRTIEDIKNVSGIGDAAFEKIKDSITT